MLAQEVLVEQGARHGLGQLAGWLHTAGQTAELAEVTIQELKALTDVLVECSTSLAAGVAGRGVGAARPALTGVTSPVCTADRRSRIDSPTASITSGSSAPGTPATQTSATPATSYTSFSTIRSSCRRRAPP